MRSNRPAPSRLLPAVCITQALVATAVDAVRINAAAVAFDLEELSPRRFSVRIPHYGAEQTGELIEIAFTAELFDFGTDFTVRLADSRSPDEVPQPVAAGDADTLQEADKLQVTLATIRPGAIDRLPPGLYIIRLTLDTDEPSGPPSASSPSSTIAISQVPLAVAGRPYHTATARRPTGVLKRC